MVGDGRQAESIKVWRVEGALGLSGSLAENRTGSK